MAKGWRWYNDRAEAIKNRIEEWLETLKFHSPRSKVRIRHHQDAIVGIRRALWLAKNERGYKRAYEIAQNYARTLK